MRHPARLLLSLGVLIAVALGGLWLVPRNGAAPAPQGGAPPAGTPAAAVPTSAPDPTPRPLSADEVPEPTPGQPIATDPPPRVPGGGARPVITQAGWAASGTGVEVAGFVAGIVEDGGSCTVTLTQGDQTVRAEVAGLADATTTACGIVELGDEEMDSGWWQAVLTYESARSRGASEPVDVLVPTR